MTGLSTKVVVRTVLISAIVVVLFSYGRHQWMRREIVAIIDRRDYAAAREMIDKGWARIPVYHPYCRPCDHTYAIHFAAMSGDYRMLEMFLNASPELINRGDGGTGQTPLELLVWENSAFASQHDDVERIRCIDLLLSRGAVLGNIVRARNENLLHRAASFRDYWLVRHLLEARTFDVNEQDAEGFTPLHYVFAKDMRRAGEKSRELSRMIAVALIEHGAQVDLKTITGKTAHDLGMEQGKDFLLDLLRE